MGLPDLTALCELGHAPGARVAVDNTVATPVLTRPFEFGADLVVHSASKYLNGHGNVLAGERLHVVIESDGPVALRRIS